MHRSTSPNSTTRRPSDQLPSRSTFARIVTSSRRSSEPAYEEVIGEFGLTTVYKPLNDAVADLVFVHGLGGGSRKTWCKDNDPALYWPKEWLPEDPDFRDVRIHMFGYDSNWGSASVLDVSEFAKNLVEWITDCPAIVEDEDEKPLILVCHSMGGLVAKRAYILARHSQQYHRVGTSLRAIFFLATPHRGSNLAELLSRILSVTPGSRPFVGDLHPSSKAIQSINEEFPRFSDDLHLHSFFETLPMSLGIKKELVVPVESATLGYPNERSTYLDANHRSVCKYDSPNSPNYRAVRNALAATLSLLRSTVTIKRQITFPKQQQVINAALDIQDPPEDDLIRVDSLKLRGSCEWITRRKAFYQWRSEGVPHIYWVTAKPGAGKSVLAGHVIQVLRDNGNKCSFFFFSHGDKLKASLSGFLRSTAWQLASHCPEIHEQMVRICKRDTQLLLADHRTIWRKLFIECIFKYQPETPHYLVIDALDEAKLHGELVHYLLQATATGFFRIFLTSRTVFDSYGITRSVKNGVHVEAINEETTNIDIELYLKENAEYLPSRDQAYTTRLLLTKADGCFLWIKLALQELRHGLTRKSIQKILDEVPSDMDQLFLRIINSTFERARDERMIVAILDWTTCAARPLSAEELHNGLRLDLNDEIDGDIKRFIEDNLGQLVVVDAQGRVRMIHLTAREFLFSPKNTAYRLERSSAHKRLAMACLAYLNSSEMVGSRPRKLSSQQIYTEQGVLASYASTALFEHINFVHSEDDEFAANLARFLRSANVLAWIEYITRHSDLGRLVQAGLALRKYTARRMQRTIPFGNAGKDNQTFDRWSTDLVRLVTKFGSRLKAYPSSITNLVAPFCPEESALRAQFGVSHRSIKVSGVNSTTWDDCASTIVLTETMNTVASGSGHFAIGLQNGRVHIYDEQACQELKVIHHGEPVKRLLFGTHESILIVTSLNQVSCWNATTWVKQWTSKLPTQFISVALTVNDTLLLATCRSNELYLWETDTGEKLPATSWLDEDIDENTAAFKRPVTTAISADQTVLAIVYRGEDAYIWDIDQETTVDVLGRNEGSLGPGASPRKGVSSAWSMIFSKAVGEAKLLVVGYNDGTINLFNVDAGTFVAATSANAHTLASSHDGLTLACGDSGGTIRLFEFETLKPLYRIQASQMAIKQIAFSADDQRLFGVQSRHAHVWDPPVLIRQTIDEENSDTISVSTAPQDFQVKEVEGTAAIMCIAVADAGNITFCGKDNGSCCLYDTTLGEEKSVLLWHAKSVGIVIVVYDALASILVTVDISSRVMAHSLQADSISGFTVRSCLLDTRIGVSVTRALLSHGAESLLVSAEQQDHLFSLRSEDIIPKMPAPHEVQKLSQPDRRNYRWITHPVCSEQLVLIIGDVAHIYSWSALEQLTPPCGIHLLGINTSLSIYSARPCFENTYLAVTLAESPNPYARREVHFFQTSQLRPEDITASTDAAFRGLAKEVHAIIGTTFTSKAHGQRLVFLHRDGWICSALNASSFDLEHYDRHYFLPADWLSSVTRLRMEVSGRDGTLLFVKRDELISVRRGLEFFETGQTRAFSKRPSLKGGSLSDSSIREGEEGGGTHLRASSAASRKKGTGTLAERLRRARSPPVQHDD